MGERVRFSPRTVVVALTVLLQASLIGCQKQDEMQTPTVEELYQEAYEIRNNLSSSQEDLKRATGLLLEAVGLDSASLKHPSPVPANVTSHRGVLRELAKALEFGHGVSQNYLLSLQFYRRAAELGDPEAHGEMAIRHAYGLQDDSSVEGGSLSQIGKADIPQALLHYSFGALDNDTVSQMALGYRHFIGFGVPQNCPTAASYYNSVAERVIEHGRLPGTLPSIEKVRLSTRAAYGFRRETEEQLLQFFQYSADMGDVDAQTTVGYIFNVGANGVTRDHQAAMRYFKTAAEAGDAEAMSYLGHMYANGLGVPRNNKTAIEWFRKGASKGCPNAHYGLGYMYLSGYGIKKNVREAYKHFEKAAESRHAEAQFHLGVMHLKGWGTRPSPVKARAFFTAAGHGGHLLALYNLAMMHLSGTGVDPKCQPAVRLLKQVAERGPWCRVLQDGHEAFDNGDYNNALLMYLRGAQMGLELAQSNAAWMLEHNLAPKSSPRNNILLALQLYKKSAEQDTVGSLLAIGDIYYYGRGIEKDWNQSAAVYRRAENRKNSRAAFNLGFMYEFGAGLPKDLHMAKRFYDLSFEYDLDAFYAAKLAVFYLNMHSWWDRARSFIPQSLHFIGDALFTLKYQNHSHVPQGWWSGRRSERLTSPGNESFVEKVMMFMDFDAVGEFFQDVFDVQSQEDMGDMVETLILGALVVVFLLVFRRRQHTRAARQPGNRNIGGMAPPPPPPQTGPPPPVMPTFTQQVQPNNGPNVAPNEEQQTPPSTSTTPPPVPPHQPPENPPPNSSQPPIPPSSSSSNAHRRDDEGQSSSS